MKVPMRGDERKCSRCGKCCMVIPIPINTITPECKKYFLERGLKEDQGFILIPHPCRHLHLDKSIGSHQINPVTYVVDYNFICDIHDSPDRPKICRKFNGQKRVGTWVMYVPPECTLKKG